MREVVVDLKGVTLFQQNGPAVLVATWTLRCQGNPVLVDGQAARPGVTADPMRKSLKLGSV